MNITVNNEGITINISKKEITGINVSAHSDYNYASLYAKITDGEYFNCSTEWKKDTDVPDFVVSLMELVKTEKEMGAISVGAWKGKEAEYSECIEASLVVGGK